MGMRGLEERDLPALADFIIEVYNDYPSALWFGKRPSDEEIGRVFSNKMRGIGMGMLIDIVAEEGGSIVGECEVARIAHGHGVVGILTRRNYRGKGLGAKMLETAIGMASEIGMRRFSAEVVESNKGALKFFVGRGFRPTGYRYLDRGGWGPERYVTMEM